MLPTINYSPIIKILTLQSSIKINEISLSVKPCHNVLPVVTIIHEIVQCIIRCITRHN